MRKGGRPNICPCGTGLFGEEPLGKREGKGELARRFRDENDQQIEWKGEKGKKVILKPV